MITALDFTRFWRNIFLSGVLVITLLINSCQTTIPTPPAVLLEPLPATRSDQQSPGLFPAGLISNHGQLENYIQYQSMGFTAGLYLSATELIWALASTEKPSQVIHMQYLDANPAVKIIPSGDPSGYISIFKGRDVSDWLTGLPAYPGVKYHRLYPGVDLHLDLTASGLKSTYFLAPGVDPGVVRWRYSPDNQVTVDYSGGDLIIAAEGDLVQLVEHAPLAWQETPSGRREVAARFTPSPEGVYSFDVAEFDPSLPLVIDPMIEFTTYLGGSKIDRTRDVKVDQNGNIYVAGYTYSTDFPNSGTFPPGGESDIFLTRFSPDGQSLTYSVVFGGSGFDEAYGLAIDDSGNIYLSGGTSSDNFPLINAVQASKGGGMDVFLVKLSSDASSLLFSTYLGGSDNDVANCLQVTSTGIAYLAGSTYSVNLPVSPGAYDETLGGTTDGFVAAYDSNTFTKKFVTYLGGSDHDDARDLAIAPDLSAYILGTTASTNFPILNPYQGTPGGGNCWYGPCYDNFITRIAATGDSLLYSSYFGGSQSDLGGSLALGQGGDLALLIMTDSKNLPAVKPLQSYMAGAYMVGDWYIARLNTQSNTLKFASYLGGLEDENIGDVAVDQDGAILIAGTTNSACIRSLNRKPRSSTSSDSLLVSIDPEKGRLIDYLYLGGSDNDEGIALTLDQIGNPIVVGRTDSIDFPKIEAYDNSYNGSEDGFLIKLKLHEDPPVGGQQIFLPLVIRGDPKSGIYGYINYRGCGLASAALDLRFYDGSSWSTLASTTSGADGSFQFSQVPTLQAGQRYYVRFLNNSDPTYLYIWQTQALDSYTAGSKVLIGDFEVADIHLSEPGNEAQAKLPTTFGWYQRAWPPYEDFEFNLYDIDTGNYFYTGPLGHVTSYTINSLPAGFKLNTWYIWYPSVYSQDGGYGESYYGRWVLFVSTLANSGQSQIESVPAKIFPDRQAPPIERAGQ